ncbi:MAG: hypothetical protein PHW69_06745 [Elusimicrobiaceae bacterium]|nr:hypothetical protein [Elusimicrobiaceae bacterium]
MNHEFLLEKSKQYMQEQEYTLAINCLDIITSSDPYNAEAFYLHGQLSFKLGKYNSALADFNHAIEAGLEDANVYLARAITYRRLNLPEMSLRDFGRVVQMEPQNIDAYSNRGLAYFSILSDDKAIEDFSHAVAIKRGPQYFFYRGLAYSRKGMDDKASADFSDEYLANIEARH